LFFAAKDLVANYAHDHCAIIGASCPFQIGDGDVQGEIKGAPNLMPALRTRFVAKPTSCLIDCCVELFCIIRDQVFGSGGFLLLFYYTVSSVRLPFSVIQ
jgi:hypothetical protein